MTAAPIGYQSTDAWVLYSVIHAGENEPAPVEKITAVGDHYNHAVFTHDELYGGLDRLLLGGWILKIGRLYQASEKSLVSYRLIQSKKLSCYDEMNELKKELSSV